MSFRFWPPGAQFFTNDGQVLAGGSMEFTDSGTTNPRTTWSDPAMTTPNPNPVPLDGAGRPNNDIWGDGSYRVTILDALGATVGTPLDNVSGPQGIPDPALQAGRFLTNDGTDIFWVAIRQVPDPTGQPDGYVLTTDGGGNTAWEPLPAPPPTPDVPTVDIGADFIELGEIGGGNLFRIQTGTATAPATGTNVTNVTVTLPVVFDTVLYVGAVGDSYPQTSIGFGAAVVAVTSVSGSGFTINLNTMDFHSAHRFTSPVGLRWFALGLIAPPP